MDVYKRVIEYPGTHGRTILALMSDLHMEAADHDREALIRDLEAAKSLNARISINGDLFDAIVPSDRKRHHQRVSSIENRDDIFNEAVRRAVDVLSPYADNIDLISPGNHERSVLKYHHLDLVSMVIFALNQARDEKLPKIHQGTYRGFQQYRFRYDSSKGQALDHGGQAFVIFRHHGRGGSAPVTGGAIDLDRIRKDFDADLYWIGHKHGNISRGFTRVSLGAKGKLLPKPQRAVMSAGYKNQYTYEEPDIDGDTDDYSESFYGLSEQGAQWVLIESEKQMRDYGGRVNGMKWSIADSPHQLLAAG